MSIETVTTPRMIGARPGPGELAEVAALFADPRVAATLGGVRTPADCALILRTTIADWEERGFGLWHFRDRETGAFVGRGGLRPVHVGGADEVEAGWSVVAERWNEGLATEMGAVAIEAAFGVLALPSLVSFTLPDNVASRRVMEKTGFTYERDVTYADVRHVLYRLPAPSS